MQRQPAQPRDESAEFELADFDDRVVPRHRGHRALVEELERRAFLGATPLQLGLDLLGGVAPTLDGALGDTGYAVDRHHVADHKDVGVARNRQVRADLHTSRAVQFDTRLLGQVLTQGARGHARRPHLAPGFDALHGAVGMLDGQAIAVHVGDHGAQLDFNAELLQALACLLSQLRAEGRQHSCRGIEQDDPRIGRVDVPEGALEGLVGQFGDLPGHFDAGRTGTHHGEGHELAAPDGIAGALGLFEGTQNATAQLESVVNGLHARRPLGEVVVSEVRLTRTGGDDQAVVGRGVVVSQQRGVDHLILQVDARHIAENDLGVVLVLQDLPRRGSDLSFGDDPGGHLVQQRLEQVMSGARDQRDIDVGTFERLGGRETAESRPDNHDSVLGRQRVLDLGLRIGLDRRRAGGGVWCRAHRSLLVEWCLNWGYSPCLTLGATPQP